MNVRPAYTVVMAAHRADAHLADAVRSVEAAMAGDGDSSNGSSNDSDSGGCASGGEFIVVANGADRDAVARCVQAVSRHGATRVETSEIAALGYCLNRGAELARGAWIARVDADDLCLPLRFAHQLRVAADSGADFVFGAADDIDVHGRPLGLRRRSSTRLWNRCEPVHPTAFMRRSALLALGGYGHLDASEDYDLWLRAAAAGYRLHADPRAVVAYRVHPLQATARARLAATFANNAGIKLRQALRAGSPALLAGAALDATRSLYRRCADACS